MTDGFDVRFHGDLALIARFDSMPEKLQRALFAKVTALTYRLENRVKHKLLGEVLHKKSGNLVQSIFSKIERTDTSVTGKVAASGNTKYAAIHEFGGVIHVPEIVPTKAQALHFVIGGRDVFAKSVKAHDVVMPERSYLRSSLTDMKQEIIDGLRDAGIKAAKDG